jgi:hypothetical protein
MPDQQATPLIDVRAKERFRRAQRDLEAALIYARPFGQSEEFKDRAEANAAADALKGLKDHVKAAEETRKELKAPYKATGDHIDREYRELLSRPKAAIEALSGKGIRFVQRERRQQEEERKAEEERLAVEAEAKAEAAAEAARKAEADPQNAERFHSCFGKRASEVRTYERSGRRRENRLARFLNKHGLVESEGDRG